MKPLNLTDEERKNAKIVFHVNRFQLWIGDVFMSSYYDYKDMREDLLFNQIKNPLYVGIAISKVFGRN